jgi:hypothetical protein
MAANNTQITLTASNQTAAAFAQVNNALGGLKTSAAGVLSSFGGIGGAIAAGGFVAFAKSVIDSADAMNDLAISTGTSVASLASYKLAAEQSGTSIEGLAKGLGKLSVFMGKNADEATRLGITARDPVEAFAQLSDALASVQDPAERNALAAKVLGKSYAELMPLLAQGGAGLRASAIESASFADTMAKLAPEADKFNDQLVKLKISTAGMAGSFLSNAIPSLNEYLAVMKEVVANGSTLDKVRFFALGNASDEVVSRVRKATEAMAKASDDARKAASSRKSAFDVKNILGGTDSAEKTQATLRKTFDIKPLDDFIVQFGDRANKIKQEYAKLTLNIGGREGPATGSDISGDIVVARGALAGGDTLKADALVERAKAGLKDLASFEQSYYARQLQDIELAMNSAAQKTAEASRDNLRAMMDQQAAELARMDPIHVPIAAEAIANDLRATIDVIRKELANNPLIIPVQAGGSTDIARAAAKLGAR